MSTSVIDFHTHILPGLDDGSQSVDMSLRMLHRMYAAGTDVVVASPHYYARREDIPSFLQRRAEALHALSEQLDGNVPRIIPGAEVAFYSGLLSDRYSDLCIEGTNVLLLEMPRTFWSNIELNILSELCLNQGIHVVLVHWERYAAQQEKSSIFAQIRELPISIQINAGTLLPLASRKKWLDLFAAGEAHLIGSDCHDMERRAPDLDKARAMILKKLGPDVLSRIDRCGAELLGLTAPTETDTEAKLLK